MELTWYLFIDGAYLRRRYAEQMKEFFGLEGEFDFARLLKALRPFKAFYYDCLEDQKRPSESDEEFRARLGLQARNIEDIQSLPGCHVRLGALSGASGKIRQKKVDILLAVDMLTHAHQKNMGGAWLIAGDLDFQPVVDALVRLGTYVRIMYDRKSAASDLLLTADEGSEITLNQWHAWSTEKFCQANPIPQATLNANPPQGSIYTPVREGLWEGRRVTMWSNVSHFLIFVEPHLGKYSLQVYDPSVDRLERFFKHVYGEIQWTQ